jgi:phosphatidate cytidylyltransferase
MFTTLSLYAFGLLYVPFLAGHIFLLKDTGPGRYYLFVIVLFIWFNDTFAYFSGTLFGTKKLPLKASPKKSYAGVAGGLLFSFLSLFLSELILGRMVSFRLAEKVFLALVFGFLVFFSDLVESALKRSVKIKDSGALLPGHGGILDRFDTWLVTIPLFYYLLIFAGKLT